VNLDSGAVLSIGVFDGVHRGHQALLAHARRAASTRALPLVAVTFDPHPMAVVPGREAPESLASLQQRKELLLAAGADAVDVLDFDASMAAMAPEEFVSRELVQRLGAREVVVGEDFRFGHRATGTVDTLRDTGRRWGFDVSAVPLLGDGAERWSSTRIRRSVAEGRVVDAQDDLGRPYALDGVVVHGDHRGRELGYPTANLQWAQRPAIPADGVYAGWLTAHGSRLPCAISVGTNPQFDGRERRVEAYVLDRDDLDLYGQGIRLEFFRRLRGQMTFASVDDLVRQMDADVDLSRQLLAGE
jgi:riboflavin kinase / FMN adenylyltransferase